MQYSRYAVLFLDEGCDMFWAAQRKNIITDDVIELGGPRQ